MLRRKPNHASTAQARVSVLTEYTPKLHGFLRRKFARNGAELQDLMQEIATAFAAVPKETVIRDPGKYLFGIANNIGCRHLSSKAREPLDQRTDVVPESLRNCSVEAAEFDAVTHDLVKQARRLPQAQNAVLRLKTETDLSNKQIAEELGLSEATVKKYLVKARAHLMGGV